MLSRCCMRCAVLETISTPLAVYKGLLVCAACQPQIAPLPCAPFAHEYRGASQHEGMWSCLRCGVVLPSVALPVERSMHDT